MSMGVRGWGYVFGIVFTLLGCTATSPYMAAPRLPVPTLAPANAAVVVFVRPSSNASSTATTLLDDRGAFLGDSIEETQFAVVLPPGPHLFLAWAENTAPLQATLLPGRTYYVEVSPRMGFLSARMQLLAITPRRESWKELSAWMKETTQLVPDMAAGQAYLDGRREDVAERIRRARERITQLSAEELQERTLYPADGVVSAVTAPAAATAPSPSVQASVAPALPPAPPPPPTEPAQATGA